MNAVLTWIEAHPTLLSVVIIPLLGALFTTLSKPRTPEQFERLPYLVAQFLRMWAAVFPDPVKLTRIVGELLTQRKATRATVPDKEEK